MPGPRSVESVRDSFPKVYAAGNEKHEVLNHWVYLDCAEPSIVLLQPAVTLGLRPVFRPVVLGVAVIPRGNPFWNVVSPLMPQPETILSAIPCTPERNL